MEPATKPCEGCGGAGLAVRADVDRLHHAEELRHLFGRELCGKCGGSGRVLANAGPAPEPRNGYVADQIAVEIEFPTGF